MGCVITHMIYTWHYVCWLHGMCHHTHDLYRTLCMLVTWDVSSHTHDLYMTLCMLSWCPLAHICQSLSDRVLVFVLCTLTQYCTQYCTQYSVHCTLYFVLRTLYNIVPSTVLCTIVLCTRYSVPCTHPVSQILYSSTLYSCTHPVSQICTLYLFCTLYSVLIQYLRSVLCTLHSVLCTFPLSHSRVKLRLQRL